MASTLRYLIRQFLILQIFGLVTKPNQKIPTAAETLGLWRLHQSTSLNFRSKIIFLKNNLILISLNVQAHHEQPDYVISALEKRPFVKYREYLYLSTLEEIWSANSIDSLTGKAFSAFQIPGVTPMGLSQQFDLQRELSRLTWYESDACTT